MGRMLPLFTAISLSMATTLQAETLEMPAETAAPASAPTSTGYSVTLPGRGMNMTQVEEKFGPPLHKLPEVGDPPIIRWVYPNYTVYFEYQFVINSVLNSTAGAPVPQAPEVEAPAETAPEAMEPAETPMPMEEFTPVDPASEAEIIPAPEAPMPAAEVEAPAPVEEPEAEVVIPSEAPAMSQ